MIEEIKNIPNSNRHIRSFGITMGIILFIISGLLMYYDKQYYTHSYAKASYMSITIWYIFNFFNHN
jgi:hypothetical protein